ncbi:MAG: enoyl-CoA hydratase-related protein [Myxococcaceae bacterium]|nr:enoyl-CoA hydratase-related protein [Myxococcaceae bacterium]MCI0671936.1 enoyl-CoA hydratase-related protein [Myxococcaceae bacterium]
MRAALHIEDLPSGVRVLSLSNPTRRNALDDALLGELRVALGSARAPAIRALLVRGEGGRAFCSGYDLTRLPDALESGPLPDDLLADTLRLLETHALPTVALVQGPAYGAGCDLALACDLRVGATDAVLCMPPARLGIVYSADGIRRLTTATRPSFAKWMVLTATPVTAERALAEGLLDEVLPTAEAEAGALALCETLARMAPLAVAGMKETFRCLAPQGPTPEQDARLRALRREAFQSDDAREGRAAFQEKRPPRFTGS